MFYKQSTFFVAQTDVLRSALLVAVFPNLFALWKSAEGDESARRQYVKKLKHTLAISQFPFA